MSTGWQQSLIATLYNFVVLGSSAQQLRLVAIFDCQRSSLHNFVVPFGFYQKVKTEQPSVAQLRKVAIKDCCRHNFVVLDIKQLSLLAKQAGSDLFASHRNPSLLRWSRSLIATLHQRSSLLCWAQLPTSQGLQSKIATGTSVAVCCAGHSDLLLASEASRQRSLIATPAQHSYLLRRGCNQRLLPAPAQQFVVLGSCNQLLLPVDKCQQISKPYFVRIAVLPFGRDTFVFTFWQCQPFDSDQRSLSKGQHYQNYYLLLASLPLVDKLGLAIALLSLQKGTQQTFVNKLSRKK